MQEPGRFACSSIDRIEKRTRSRPNQLQRAVQEVPLKQPEPVTDRLVDIVQLLPVLGTDQPGLVRYSARDPGLDWDKVRQLVVEHIGGLYLVENFGQATPFQPHLTEVGSWNLSFPSQQSILSFR